MIKTIAFCLAVCALASTLTAQTTRAAPDDDRIAVRGVAFVSRQLFAASTTFDAAFENSSGRFFGGGASIIQRGFFLDVMYSRLEKTGQRAYIFNGQAYPLGIPLTMTITPFEVSGGYRFNRASSIIPYAGAGVGSYGYSETSSFADTGDDVEARHVGVLVLGGAEFRLHRLVGVAADVQYTHVPGILGSAGLSKEAGESDLGGIAFRAKVVVGVGH